MTCLCINVGKCLCYKVSEKEECTLCSQLLKSTQAYIDKGMKILAQFLQLSLSVGYNYYSFLYLYINI